MPYEKPLPGKGVTVSNPLTSKLNLLLSWAPDIWCCSAARYAFLDETLTGCDVHSRSKHALTSRLAGNAVATALQSLYSNLKYAVLISAEGLFSLDAPILYHKDGCTKVDMSAQYNVQSMGLQVQRKGTDITAVLPLEPGNNRLHGLVVAEREAKLWGFGDRRFAPSIESSWPRKKGDKAVVTYSLQKL